jgi:class 3 adenylate cyclase
MMLPMTALSFFKKPTRWSWALMRPKWPTLRIEFHIGIHIGDVVEESDGDLMGDGVNIAARLEGIAKAGAVCLSEDAYRQVKSRLDLLVTDLGATHLKNIAEPMRVYSLQVGSAVQTKPTPAAQVSAPEAPVRHVLSDSNSDSFEVIMSSLMPSVTYSCS